MFADKQSPTRLYEHEIPNRYKLKLHTGVCTLMQMQVAIHGPFFKLIGKARRYWHLKLRFHTLCLYICVWLSARSFFMFNPEKFMDFSIWLSWHGSHQLGMRHVAIQTPACRPCTKIVYFSSYLGQKVVFIDACWKLCYASPLYQRLHRTHHPCLSTRVLIFEVAPIAGRVELRQLNVSVLTVYKPV